MSRLAVGALVLAALLTGAAVLGAARLETQVDFVDTVPAHAGLDAYRDLLESLEGIRFLAVYMPALADADLRTPDGFDTLVEEQADLLWHLEREAPHVVDYDLSARAAMAQGNYMLERMARGGDPPSEAYRVPEDPVRYDLVRQRVLDEPSLDQVVAPDGSSAILLLMLDAPDLTTARPMAAALDRALADWDRPAAQATGDPASSGLVWSSQVTDERNRMDMVSLAPLAALAVGLVVLVLLRRVTDAALAALGLGVATLWTFGALGLLGIPVSFLTVFLAPVVMGVGIDGALHALHGFEAARERDASRPMRRAIVALRRPIVLSAATSATALLAMGLVPAPLFAQVGLVAALGILLALAATFFVVIPLRTLLPRPQGRVRRDGTGPVLGRLAGRVHRERLLAAGVVLIVFVAAGITAVQGTHVVSGAADNEFPQDDPLILLQKRIEEEYGAFQRAYIIVRGDIADPEALAALDKGTQQAASLPLFQEASSVVALLRADAATDQGAFDVLLGAAGQPTGQDPDALPSSTAAARIALARLWEDPMWGKLVPFTSTRDQQLAVVAITLAPTEDRSELRTLSERLHAIAADLQSDLPDHDVAAGGAPLNRAAILEQTPRDMQITVFGGLAAVVLVAALGIGGSIGWRLRTGLGAAIVVGGAALITLAAVPLLNAYYQATGSANTAALNDMFLLAFAVTVGVGVDDWIHVAHAARTAPAGDARARIEHAFSRSGRAITGTTATTFAAFLVLASAYFLQSKNLAILTLVGISSAYLLTLLLGPVLLAAKQTSPP